MSIDISVTTLRNEDKLKELSELKIIKGIVIYSQPEYYTVKDDTVYTKPALTLSSDNEFSSGTGYHYVIDEETILSCVPDNKQTTHLKEGKNTFIHEAMYDNKANENAISILLVLPEKDNYEVIERKTIKFIAKYLLDKNLTSDSVMRAFDLNKSPSPLHLLKKEKWRAFIDAIQSTYTAMKEQSFKDSMLEEYEPQYTDEEVRKFYIKYTSKCQDYADNYEPDHRDIEELVNYRREGALDIETFTTTQNTVFTYGVTNTPSDADHCAKAFDKIVSKAEPKTLDVEPIYPDIIIPPGGTVTLADSITATSVTQESSITLSVEEFEKREKIFNIKEYKNVKKEVKGKPVNNNDPYPVDEKIKELESHIPKVKIDEVNSTLFDCNHPGSVAGPSINKNFAMVQDEVITLAKRTERRLVKLENNLSTVMRYLFRAASRMQINCVYYGGQDIYGKYKCIRCLHDDRINDGQSMTLDQCLSCTRYEPILGQVYAILDDTSTNVSQVLDDIQMAYMNMDDYVKFTRTEEIHKTKEYADVTKVPAENPKTFYESYSEDEKEGFKMDWNDVALETQRPNIAEYNTENMTANRPEVVAENQGEVLPEFKETIEENEEYERLVYNSEEYIFNNYGSSTSMDGLSNGYFGMGGTEIRNKIVEYAQKAYDLCQEGKAGYSQDLRYNHLDKAIDGISYWDCSSLVEGAYKSAGITTVAGNTSTEYPVCLPGVGGLIFPASQISEALPGDICFMTNQSPKPSTADELNSAATGSIYHVSIYIGNNEHIHASTAKAELTKQIKKNLVTNNTNFFAFGRPKALVDADKAATKDLTSFKYTGEIPFPNYKKVDSLPANKKENLKKMSDLAIRASLQYPELFPSIVIATFAAENGWGTTDIAVNANNYFNINGEGRKDYYQSPNGRKWRKYNSMEESVLDYFDLIINQNPYRKNEVYKATNASDQLMLIDKSGYCEGAPGSYHKLLYYSFMCESANNFLDADRVAQELRAKLKEEGNNKEDNTEETNE